jgi:hypothetical protein
MKGRVLPVHAMKSYRGFGGTAPPILNLGTRCDDCSTSRPGRFISGREPWCPLNRRPGWPHSLSGPFEKQKKFFAHAGNRSLNPPGRSPLTATITNVGRITVFAEYKLNDWDKCHFRKERSESMNNNRKGLRIRIAENNLTSCNDSCTLSAFHYSVARPRVAVNLLKPSGNFT